jgi:hypothetical protein
VAPAFFVGVLFVGVVLVGALPPAPPGALAPPGLAVVAIA